MMRAYQPRHFFMTPNLCYEYEVCLCHPWVSLLLEGVKYKFLFIEMLFTCVFLYFEHLKMPQVSLIQRTIPSPLRLRTHLSDHTM